MIDTLAEVEPQNNDSNSAGCDVHYSSTSGSSCSSSVASNGTRVDAHHSSDNGGIEAFIPPSS